jgi:hypothetical protein
MASAAVAGAVVWLAWGETMTMMLEAGALEWRGSGSGSSCQLGLCVLKFLMVEILGWTAREDPE